MKKHPGGRIVDKEKELDRKIDLLESVKVTLRSYMQEPRKSTVQADAGGTDADPHGGSPKLP